MAAGNRRVLASGSYVLGSRAKRTLKLKLTTRTMKQLRSAGRKGLRVHVIGTTGGRAKSFDTKLRMR